MTCNCAKCRGEGEREEGPMFPIHPSRIEDCKLCGEEKMKGKPCQHCWDKGIVEVGGSDGND